VFDRLFHPQKKVTFDDLCRKTNETRIFCMDHHFSHLIQNAPEIMEQVKPLQKFSSSKHENPPPSSLVTKKSCVEFLP
jgi:hypothetical protein